MADWDAALRELVEAIVAGDVAEVSRRIAASPELAASCCEGAGATRQNAPSFFLDPIGRYIYRGDTGLHFAAAAYQLAMVEALIAAGAKVGAKNRLGDEPLHAAAAGQPGSAHWNPTSQAATISLLIRAGADPNAANQEGVTPLHRAVRTRCAEAVRALLEAGADPGRRNRGGSTPMRLAVRTTGRSGSGSAEAKEQQRQILRLLEVQGASRET